ncbi:LysM peptidoglycan-binding domain-containing protein [Candidatus Saccharibacteria bacterium]|nr:LysM peptidoglycan-binding domain-containing protein [Candidatus Saccharibacteria bacterium]
MWSGVTKSKNNVACWYLSDQEILTYKRSNISGPLIWWRQINQQSKFSLTEKKEFFISRKVLGLPLEVRRESFVGVGQFQTFSQTKTQSSGQQPATYTQAKKKLRDRVRSLVFNKTEKKSIVLRLGVHSSLLGLALALVLVGKVATQPKLALITSGGQNVGSGDQSSEIATGAVLAADSQGVVAQAVSQKAQDMNSQVALNTAADDFLTKKSPVLTAEGPRTISSYTVKDGDTLSSLAQKFNITSNTLKWVNGISDENSVKPGDKLTILPVNGVLLTATGGEDIGQLAAKYQANAAMIDSYNNLEGKAPLAGVQLIIPDGVIQAAPALVAASAPATATPAPTFASKITLPSLSGSGSLNNGYAYGYCTYYVASRRNVPNGWGDARYWYGRAGASGFATGSAPRAGAIAWDQRNINHVAYVESVNGDGTITVSEMNFNGAWNRVTWRTAPASQFLYIY